MTVPDIITKLARVVASAKETQKRFVEPAIFMTIDEAEAILALWRNMQDDGK